MVSVRFSCGTLSLTLPQVSDFAPTGYPGLTYRPKWQRGNPDVLPNSDMTQSISLKPPRKVQTDQKLKQKGMK